METRGYLKKKAGSKVELSTNVKDAFNNLRNKYLSDKSFKESYKKRHGRDYRELEFDEDTF